MNHLPHLQRNGRRLLHYQVGVYNGEGINQKDTDQRKDIIGGLWVMPIQGVRIGAFGWTGSRADVGGKNRYPSGEVRGHAELLRSGRPGKEGQENAEHQYGF